MKKSLSSIPYPQPVGSYAKLNKPGGAGETYFGQPRTKATAPTAPPPPSSGAPAPQRFNPATGPVAVGAPPTAAAPPGTRTDPQRFDPHAGGAGGAGGQASWFYQAGTSADAVEARKREQAEREAKEAQRNGGR